MNGVVFWSVTVPAGTYSADQGVPLFPQRVRRMNKRRQKKWLQKLLLPTSPTP
jgi:hypothetical protein